MVHGQDHHLLVDNAEEVSEFFGVSNAGDVIEARTVLFQKGHKFGDGSIAEAENNTAIDTACGGVPGDAAQ